MKYEYRHFIYMHIRPDKNEPFYIGIGTNHIDKSLYYRAFSKRNRNNHWKNIVKLNPDYIVKILEESNDYSFIRKREIELIAEIGLSKDGLGTLCNLVKNTSGVTFHTEETKKKIANTIKENYRKGIMKSNKGIKLILTEEQREKRSKAHIGKKHTEETKIKIGLIHKNKVLSEKDKQRLKEWNKINSSKNKRKIIQMDMEGNFIKEWESIKSASIELNINANGIVNACKGKYSHAGKFLWKYKENNGILNLEINYK